MTVYDQLLAEINDHEERQVLEILLAAGSEPVTRPDLVFRVYGVYVQGSALAGSTEDRKIRTYIARLRKRDYLIVSTSGEAGYCLQASPEEIEHYIAEQEKRINSLNENIRAARRSQRRAPQILEYRRQQQASQPRLI